MNRVLVSVKTIFTEKAPKPIGPYSQAVAAGNMVFVSGQIGIDPRSGRLVEGGVREQARQALLNLKAILEASGCTMDDVLLTIVFLKDMQAYRDFNEAYSEFFRTPPARAVVGVDELPAGALVEILAIAFRPSFRSEREG
ncbi:MAG: RidA family protein [Thermofilaceae archaeon]